MAKRTSRKPTKSNFVKKTAKGQPNLDKKAPEFKKGNKRGK